MIIGNNEAPHLSRFSAEYPYINYFVIQRPRDEVNEFYRVARSEVYDAFCPTKLGYKCEHSIDLYTVR